MDLQSMMGKNRSSKKVLQKKVGNLSSLENVVLTTENMVMFDISMWKTFF